MNALYDEPEFVPPDPIDPLDRAWPAPAEPGGPGWWLFDPEEARSETAARCSTCDGEGTIDGFEPCPHCGGCGERPDWWS